MKKVKNLPEDHNFFSEYIGLVKTLNSAGMLGQIVSALTEIGGIYVAAFLAFSPILPAPYPMYLAAIIAAIGTAIIEIGLRVALPKTVDAVLYRRFSGLHLVITVFTITITLLLYSASTFLSFSNSTTIVENVTSGGHEIEIAKIDSMQAAETERTKTTFQAKRAAIDSTYNAIIAASAGSQAAKVQAAKRELQNIINKEARTGQSFATQKDAARLKLSQADAALNEAQAKGIKEKAEVLKEHDEKEEAALFGIAAKADGKRAEAELKQSGKVGKYGGGLAYFTILGNILLLVSIVINQVMKKGAGMKETVQLSQYDVNPHWLTQAVEAFSERFNYTMQNAITNFSNRTPPPPLPTDISELYDPSDIAQIRARLKAEEAGEEEYTVSRKRREIKPFGGKASAEDENNLPYYTLSQRYKDYRKRVSSHIQKAKKHEKKGEPVPPRTLAAIENNKVWRDHYKALMDNYKG